VIATDRDPTAMTAMERLTAIAEILAAGYVRLSVARALSQKGLDASRGSEAQCGSKAMNPKSTEESAA
jgi:hypothetical protein